MSEAEKHQRQDSRDDRGFVPTANHQPDRRINRKGKDEREDQRMDNAGLAMKLGLRPPLDVLLTGEGLKAYREAYCSAIRALHSQGNMARTWPLRYLIRHTAYHTLDHAWEMEDKDLTVK